MKVYDQNGEIRDDYIGQWYEGQINPQDLALHIQSDTKKVYIATRYSNSWSCDEFNHIDTYIYLPFSLLSYEESESLIEEVKEFTDNLLESFDTYYDGKNYKGSWDIETLDDLEIYLQNEVMQSELCWDYNGELETEEVEE